MVVSKQSVLTNLEIDARSLSAAAAPGKFEPPLIHNKKQGIELPHLM